MPCSRTVPVTGAGPAPPAWAGRVTSAVAVAPAATTGWSAVLVSSSLGENRGAWAPLGSRANTSRGPGESRLRVYCPVGPVTAPISGRPLVPFSTTTRAPTIGSPVPVSVTTPVTAPLVGVITPSTSEV